MGPHKLASASTPAERRAVGRARTDCPARLETPFRKWHGRLWDLSESGARIQVADPPVQGVSAIVSWPGAEVFGRAVWSAEDMCGVMFERPISREVVRQTLGQAEAAPESRRAASVGKIPLGKRRSRLGGGGGKE